MGGNGTEFYGPGIGYYEELSPFILVMGETGAGKSTFIKTLAPDSAVHIEHTLSPGTSTSTVVPVKIGPLSVNLVDTPGFNDLERSDGDILLDISKCLITLSLAGGELKGIIYLHNLAMPRFSGTCSEHIEMLRRICGPRGIGNLFLISSNWNDQDERSCIVRENSLQTEHWRDLIRDGATFTRFRNSRDSAEAIVCQCAYKDPVVFELQREISEDRVLLERTSAGLYARDRRLQRHVELGRIQTGGTQDSRGHIEKSIEVARADEQKLRVDVLKETGSRFKKFMRSKGNLTLIQIIVSLTGIGLTLTSIITGAPVFSFS
ncbi:gTPase, IMAP member 8 [Orbilia javanica]|uniref:GTPase, IMAP member 8 n=1 Tax=Orbilia javanica TaxID=47235 RepID=A0AAN8MZ56_9PEZI